MGRRVELIHSFRNAANRLNIELEIYGADVTESAPALQFCDHAVMVPRICDDRYLPMLQNICKTYEINALIPTIDTDLLLLSQHKYEFGSARVIISESEKIALCRDKRRTSDYFRFVGLKSPSSVDDYKNYKAGYPAFIKPKDGSSSIFAYKVESEEELKTFSSQVPDYIIQPFIDGTEYTVDIFCDFEGNPIYITPRIRLMVRAGEVLKTEISQDNKILSEMKQLLADYKPCGPITVQLIREKNTGEDYYIEINPRFGGGAPLSIKAGADSAEALLRLLQGETLSYVKNAAEHGAMFSRYDESVRVK